MSCLLFSLVFPFGNIRFKYNSVINISEWFICSILHEHRVHAIQFHLTKRTKLYEKTNENEYHAINQRPYHNNYKNAHANNTEIEWKIAIATANTFNIHQNDANDCTNARNRQSAISKQRFNHLTIEKKVILISTRAVEQQIITTQARKRVREKNNTNASSHEFTCLFRNLWSKPVY